MTTKNKTKKTVARLYFAADGAQITVQDIESAFDLGAAVLVHRYGSGDALALDGNHYDTRNDTDGYMRAAAWTTTPKSLGECLRAAGVNL